MDQDNDSKFLLGKIESLKRQLAECTETKQRCKSKNTALARLVKRLKYLNNLKNQ